MTASDKLNILLILYQVFRLKHSFEIFPTGFNACIHLSILFSAYNLSLPWVNFKIIPPSREILMAIVLEKSRNTSAGEVLHQLLHNTFHKTNSISLFIIFPFFGLISFFYSSSSLSHPLPFSLAYASDSHFKVFIRITHTLFLKNTWAPSWFFWISTWPLHLEVSEIPHEVGVAWEYWFRVCLHKQSWTASPTACCRHWHQLCKNYKSAVSIRYMLHNSFK